MKITKLMLAACAVVLALVSCNKENTTPELSGNLKSVTLTLDNVSFETKGANDFVNPRLDNTEVKLGSIQFFFSDGSSLYIPKNADGSDAKTYFTTAELAAADLSFHSLPASVSEVYAIGNEDEIQVGNNDPLSKLHMDLSIGLQQNPDDLTLYAFSNLVPMAAPAGDHSTHVSATKVYSATLAPAPRVARFEIDKISCDFSATPLFNSVEAIKIAFADYYQVSDLFTGTVSGGYSIDASSQNTIFSFLDGKNGGWDCDVWTTSPALTPSSESAEVNLAYNFFPPVVSGNLYPRFALRVTTNNNEGAYVMTVKFKKTDNTELAVTDFKAGVIYRITDFAFKDTDLTHQERCVEITVDVIEWSVVPIYPTFN